ncbi:MAG: stage II sporulation protein M [Clostridiaceae bacterium]
MKKILKNDFIRLHVKENIWLYILSAVCVCTGMVIGIYSVRYMDSVTQTELLNYIASFSTSKLNSTIPIKDLFFSAIKNNIFLIVGIWFLGLTMIGLPIILVLQIVKGYTLGFTFSFFINIVGLKGIGLAFLGVLPQNLIYIPLLLFASVVAMQFSISILKDNNLYKNGVLKGITRYTVVFVFVCILMNIGFIIEAVITPNLLRLI